MAKSVRIAAVYIFLLPVLIFAGCSDDDPVAPIQEQPEPLAVSPDSLATMFRTALDEMDSQLLESLLADDFRYSLNSETIARNDLPTTFLNRAETLQSLGLIFAGQEASGNVLDAEWGEITGVRVTHFTQMTDWEEAGDFSPYPGSVESSWNSTLDFELADGASLLRADQRLNLYATAVDTVLSDGSVAQRYELVRIYDWLDSSAQAQKSESMLLGEILCSYLVPSAPTAMLTLSDAGGFPYALIECDATGSMDPVHGLAPVAFNFADASLEGRWFSSWREATVFLRSEDAPGTYPVQVTVRNRWNLTAMAVDSVTVAVADPPAATTGAILVDNVVGAYQTMATEALASQLDDQFKMILRPEVQDEWGWSSDFHFDRDDFVQAHTQMFRGDPGADANGNVVHPIAGITIDVFEQQAAWQQVPPQDVYFGGVADYFVPYQVGIGFYNADLSHRFLVRQQVLVYATEIDNMGTTEYRLVGLRALSSSRKTDDVGWDDVIALYR